MPKLPVGAVARFLRQRGVTEKTQPSQPVVDRHEHDTVLRKRCTVVHAHRARAEAKCTAVDPHHHWTLFTALRRVHVQRQAVLTLREHSCSVWTRWLRTALPEFCCRTRVVPRRRALRRAPAQVADRRRRIRDTFKHTYPALVGTFDESEVRLGGRASRPSERRYGSKRHQSKGAAHSRDQNDLLHATRPHGHNFPENRTSIQLPGLLGLSGKSRQVFPITPRRGR